MKPMVLSIGQCMPDADLIERYFSALGATAESVATELEARTALQSRKYRLVLGNRVFDSDGASGVHVLAALSKLPSCADTIFMLISNYEDAQSEALACGLTEGFGKAEIRDEKLKQRLLELLRG